MRVLKVLLFSVAFVLGVFGVLVFATKPAQADQCIGGWVVGDGYCGGWNVCHFGNCPCGCGTGCRDSWDNHWCWYDSGENKCWSNLFYSCAGFDYATCVGQGGCQWCVSAQSCPTGCGYGGGYVPDGSCGQTYCSPTATCNYTVTGTAGSGGTISPASSTVTPGGTTTFTVTPNTGYYISSVTGCSGSLSGNTYTTGAVNSNCTVSAGFAIYTYTITTSAGANGTISPGGTVSVNYGSSKNFAITPNTGYHVLDVVVDGASVSAVSSYTFSNVVSNHTIAASFDINTYTVSTLAVPASGGSFSPTSIIVNHGSTTSFTVTPAVGYHTVSASGCGGSLAGAVYTTGAITGVCTVTATFDRNNGTLAVKSIPYPSNPSFNAPFTYTGPSSGSGNTPANISLYPGSYTITFGSVAGYLLTSTTPAPPTGTVTSDATVTVTGNYTATSALTVNLYNDHNANGILDTGDGLVGGALRVTCSPSGSADCVSPLSFTGSRSLSLLQGTAYTFTYDISDPVNVAAGYRFVTGNRKDGNPGPPPYVTQTITMDASPHTIDFLVTTNSPAWIQAWDGDVYSGYNANPSQPGIKITVNSQAGSVGYSPVFIHESLGGLGGGLAMASAGSYGVDCNSLTCSETRNWVISGYASPLAWPDVVDVISTGSTNVCYESGPLTVGGGNISTYNGAGACAGKVVIVNSDLTFDATGIPGANRQVSAYFVVKGHVSFTNVSGSTNPWVINGGLLSKSDSTGIDFSYSLDDNKVPAVVFKYNPDILLRETPISKPSYSWREVAAL